ncbi:TraB/GumN family protein [Methylocella sp.]|uniref:TraB/GumN family protein n=1 Tax=Methylocella sp. TaxID=1978226 RepID=UPI0035AEB72F
MAARGFSAPAARRACATSGERRQKFLAAILAATLTLLSCAPTGALAACAGRDLLPLIAERAPAAFAALEAEAARTPFRHGALFRVAYPGAPPSFVFGTLHLSDPRAAPASAAAALARSRAVLVETVEDGARLHRLPPARALALRAALRAGSGERARDLLDADALRRLAALGRAAGFAPQAVADMKPAALALVLDLPPCARAADYADAWIAAAARARGLTPVGLETLAEQIEALGPLDARTATALLEATLKQASAGEDIVETSLILYARGDLGALLAFMRMGEPLPGVAGSGTPPEFLDLLIDRRSARMAERAAPYLKAGGAFLAVGAAHLPGEKGLLRDLERRGFSVERAD